MDRRKFLRNSALGGLGAAAGWQSLQSFSSSPVAGSTRPKERPNIVVILADDMGFSDIGPYGATEIQTPNLDRLAAGGQRFSQFYNAARCSPTRASLLTGLYPHQAGMGWLDGHTFNDPPPGYLGHLNDQCVTLGETMRRVGYETMMVGKWHVGYPRHDTAPWTRGFDRYFGRLVRANYWDSSELRLDGRPYDWPIDKDFYMTDAQGAFATRFIAEHQQTRPDQPFFMYMAFNAPHWPLHAPERDIARYRGRFMIGWDELRKRRYEKLTEQGVIGESQPLSPRDPAVPAWRSIPDENKRHWDLKMAVYAAMIGRLDRAIGQVIDRLETTGELDNTLVLFLSDNGASAEGMGRRQDLIGPGKGIPPGGPDSFQGYLMPWANASCTPFRMFKHWTNEGGIATPLIAHWPAGIAEGQKGRVTDAPGYLIDVMATALDVAGADYPETYRGREITPLQGKSLLPVFRNGSREGHERLFWEHEGHRAVREGKWKLVSMHHDDEVFYDAWGYPREGLTSEWALYDLATDRTELNDVAGAHPERVAHMAAAYDRWADRVGVVDWDIMQCKSKRAVFQRVCDTK